MNVSLVFIRILFAIISIFFLTTYMVSRPEGDVFTNTLMGILIGSIFSILLVIFDILFRRFNLRSFNIAIVGLFIGYLMGQVLVLILDAILDLSSNSFVLSPHVLEIMKISFFLFGTYLGSIMTLRASDELYISIPFVKFAPTMQKKRDLLLDASVLADVRIIDVCSTGLLDQHLVIPRFVVKELYTQVELDNEFMKAKARRSLEVIDKLEQFGSLGVRFNDTDFPEVHDTTNKLLRLARLIDANILTADISRIQISSIEGIHVVNLHTLSNALKPIMEMGEILKIKVQRYGKEPRQGVGYLEDGTMVVINGGGNFIGDVIGAQVLSVKHTSSGRMIFCNALEGETQQNNEQQQGNFEGEYD